MSTKLPRRMPKTNAEWVYVITKIEEAINALSAKVSELEARVTKIGG